jgi:predicted MFS family arabinose efflux permease
MFAVAAVGAVVGGGVSSYIKRRPGLHVAYVASNGVLAVVFAAMPRAGSFALTAMVAVAFTLCDSMRGVLGRSRRQEVTPDLLLGRVTAAIFIVTEGGRLLGAAVVGLTADRYGYGPTCQVLAVALVVLMVATIPATSLRETKR